MRAYGNLSMDHTGSISVCYLGVIAASLQAPIVVMDYSA
jgi:hypothetical protein